VYPMYAPSPVYPLQCGKCGGIFLWEEHPKFMCKKKRRKNANRCKK